MNWKHLRVQETFGCLQHWRAICLRNINKKRWKTAKKKLITRPFAWDIFSIPTGFAGFLPYLPSKMNRNNSNTIFENTSYYANRSGIYYTVATFINLPGRTINQCQSKMMKCQCQIHQSGPEQRHRIHTNEGMKSAFQVYYAKVLTFETVSPKYSRWN